MSSKMEQIIEEIEDYIDGCKPSPISRNKILVNREQLEELLSELRTKTPEEVKRYQKIISNKEAILADAQAKADQIIAQAQIQTNELVSEHQIMQQAYYQAQEIVNQATDQANQMLEQANQDANQIRLGALSYTNDLLGEVEKSFSKSLASSKAQYEGLIQTLQGSLDVIAGNRKELFGGSEQEEAAPAMEPQQKEEQPASEEDYQFDEDTFLDNADE